MKLDSADLSLANGQVITVLDLTIQVEGEETAGNSRGYDVEGHESARTASSVPARLVLRGKTAAVLHVGEELCLDALADVPGGLALPHATVVVSKIEPADSSLIHFTTFQAASPSSQSMAHAAG